MSYQNAITTLISRRYSCRSYTGEPLEAAQRQALQDFIAALPGPPFGSAVRLELIAATEEDRGALKGLGTYGFIKGATAFIVGAVRGGARDMEDFGEWMERVVLCATDLELGTCWLGGSFTKSSFAQKVAARDDEIVPAVVAVGEAAEKPRWVDRLVRQGAGSDQRKPWEALFFDGDFAHPLPREAAEEYAPVLDMVRRGPSASNKQPWRIVKGNGAWQLYLQRTPGYGKQTLGLVKIADMQRIDMGIAMTHFALTAQELGLPGHWELRPPQIALPDAGTEYNVSWVMSNG